MAGKVIQRDKYHKYNLRDDIHDVYLAYADGEAVGYGSYKRYDTENAELKRVFLRKEYRGQGIAKKLLSLIERDTKNAGYQYMILETGELLKESVGLYRHTGDEYLFPLYVPFFLHKALIYPTISDLTRNHTYSSSISPHHYKRVSGYSM